jgi:hypothetical protein
MFKKSGDFDESRPNMKVDLKQVQIHRINLCEVWKNFKKSRNLLKSKELE